MLLIVALDAQRLWCCEEGRVVASYPVSTAARGAGQRWGSLQTPLGWHRIRAKIGWEGPDDIADRTFLNAYYAALRGRLESRMLFGHRRKDKFDVS